MDTEVKRYEIKIETGIPLPKYGLRGRKIKYPFRQMNIGDSFYLEKPNPPPKKHGTAQWYSKIYGSAKAQGARCAVRQERDGIRVWRIA